MKGECSEMNEVGGTCVKEENLGGTNGEGRLQILQEAGGWPSESV